MLVPALLALLLLDAQVSPQAPTFDQAVQMANDGRDADALRAFQQIVAGNPDDLKARLWIAQLHERRGEFDRAEPVYLSIILADPQNLDAILGFVNALLARNEHTGAMKILEAAEKFAPQDGRVLAAVGRANQQAGRNAEAITYFQRAVTVSPTTQHRLLLEEARRSYLSRIEVRGFAERFNVVAPEPRTGTLAVNLRLNDKLRLIGRGDVQRRLGVQEERGGGGFEWRWKPDVTLRGQALVKPDNLVLPEGDYLGEVAFTRGAATWTAGIRYFDFTGAKVTVFSPAVAWPVSPRLALGLRYAYARTETYASSGTFGHTFQADGTYRLHPRLSLLGAYAAGVDDFESYTIDRIGDFRADAITGGLRIELPTLTDITAASEFQWRPNTVTMGRVIFALSQRF